MSQWRQEAISRFPELQQELGDAEDAGWMWHALYQRVKDAYPLTEANEDFVHTVYEYASWCINHRSIDVRTAAALWFYEDLLGVPSARKDMPRWISLDDFEQLESVWEYNLKQPGELAAFKQEFYTQRRDLRRKAERRQIRNKKQRKGSENPGHSIINRDC